MNEPLTSIGQLLITFGAAIYVLLFFGIGIWFGKKGGK